MMLERKTIQLINEDTGELVNSPDKPVSYTHLVN